MFIIKPILLCILAVALGSAFQMGNIECEIEPEPVSDSTLKCDHESCKLECNEDLKFPRGERVLEIECVNNKTWGVKRYGNLLPDCEATCVGGCKNGGKCVAPNFCVCKENFVGRNCETKVETCPEKPKLPGNTMGKCVVTGSQKYQTCKVTCMEGFKFPDGTLTSDILCRNEQWIMTPKNFTRCEPYCNPQCQNRGTCVGPNLCQCTGDFRGNMCQYSIERCSPKKLGFNGMYKCTGTADELECQLSCPSGFETESPLASTYTCRFDEGVFSPEKAPLCDYKGMQYEISHAK